jgi:[acyl-carrier-protein] S-malonyltransferase
MAKTALLFAGQGAQVVGMGRDLAEAHPTAKSLFAEADEALGYGLSEICFSGPEEELVRTEHAQPAIYLVGWIALKLLREQAPSISFEATAGLSLGEFTALAAADAIGFEDGLRVVRRRGELMQEACEASSGGMAAIVGLDEEAVRGVCEQAGVSLANLNCPGQIVVSGDADKMDAACEAAKAAGAKRAIPLPVAGAYHSPLMQPAQAGLAEALASGSGDVVRTLGGVHPRDDCRRGDALHRAWPGHGADRVHAPDRPRAGGAQRRRQRQPG